jgi:F420H(2)-dependent quinone reductase
MQIRMITTGRRSGRPHQVNIYAWPDGERLTVVGSYAGRPRDPDWVANLRSNPGVTVHRGREAKEYMAHQAEGDERARLWDLVTTAFPMYETYQRKTERVIPLFVLEPAGERR